LERYKHKDWYLTEDTAVDVAHRTATLPQPEIVTNDKWIEARLLPLVLKSLKVSLANQQFDLVLELFTSINSYLKSLAQQGDLGQGFDICEKWAGVILETIGGEREELVLEGEIFEHVGIIESMATLPIGLLIAYCGRPHKMSRENILQALSGCRWDYAHDLYKRGFPHYVLPRLEWLKSRLQFELAAEGQIVSPLWYQTEMVAQIEAEQFEENIDSLFNTSTHLYQNWLDILYDAKRPWLAAAVLSRCWEYWNKMSYHFDGIEATWNDLSDQERIKGLPWPQQDVEHWNQFIQDQKSELAKRMATQSIELSMPTRPEHFPDYRGQFLHAIGEATFDTFASGDMGIIKTFFPAYFYGCLRKFDELRPRSAPEDWRVQQELRVAIAPLLDLMELSGFARLYGDFHQINELWDVVKGIWDSYLSEEETFFPAELFATAVGITNSTFEIPHRGLLRTNWQLRVMHDLRNLPKKRVREELWMGIPGEPKNTISHSSPLVRVFAGDVYGSFYDGIDIFVSLYLRDKLGEKFPDVIPKFKDLKDAIRREEENFENNADESEKEE